MNFLPIPKKHALVALGIILFLTAISLGTFALAQPIQNVAPALLGTITPTPAHPDWKEYSNPAFGYSLRYPPNMVYREWQPAADILQSVSFYLGEDISQPIYLIPEVSVTVFANPNKQSARDWTMAHSVQAGKVPDKSSAAAIEAPASPRAVRVAGNDGVTVEETAGLVRDERAVLSRENAVYSISYTDLGDAKLKSTHADMLSTLRLTTPSAPIQLPSGSTPAESISGIAPASPNALAPSGTGLRLPWASGETYRILQSWGGSTHRCPGQMCYAYDFDNGSVPFEGTPVRASADGVVAFVKGDSAANVCGGYDYRKLGNYVVVYHTDGTATLYLHLKQASVGFGALANGRGTIIGLAGKTGWTGCYAHLHFQRQGQGDWATNSVPVYFDEYAGQQLKYLQRYTSQNAGGGTSTCSTPSPNHDQIGLYQHDNYCGAYKILGIGEYPNPAAMGFPNDQLSSVKVGADVSATLCRDDNYSGGCVTLFSDNPVLRSTSVGNDQVSSVKVSTFQGEWKGEYFNNQNLSGTPALVRSDSSINFNWGTGSPGSGINSDHFSARWTRTLNFTEGTWRFTTTTDDGVRLWVDDRLLIDKWINQNATSYSADMSLSSGNHSVKMEYYDNTVDAVAKMTYALVTTTPPGSGWRSQYFNNMTLSGSPALERDDAQINFDWGNGSPGSGVNSDQFSVRWSRTLNFAAGTWRFTTTTDDGVRLWLDDRLVIDKWVNQSATAYSADAALSAGNHSVKIEYYENTGNAVAKLTFALVNPTPQPGSGWRGQYFNNMTLTGAPALERDDPQINFDWGTGSPGAGIGSDHFSVRWTRTLNLAGGTWRFSTTTDDGVRLWVDDRLLIDKWRDQSATSYSADVALPAGNHTVKMEYYENADVAVARMILNLMGTVPTDSWDAQYYSNMTLSGSPALERDDAQINFDWDRGSPDSSIPSDHFSARWTRALNLAAGVWHFTVTADDGVRLWIDDRLVIDKWIDQAASSYSADVNVAGGNHTLKMEYYEDVGNAVAKLSYSQVSAALARSPEPITPAPTATVTSEATPTTQAFAPQLLPTSSPNSPPPATTTSVPSTAAPTQLSSATAAPTQAPSATATVTTKPSNTSPAATPTPRPLRSATPTAPKPTSVVVSITTPTAQSVALQATLTPRPTETPVSFEIEPPQEAALPATPAPNPTTAPLATETQVTTWCGLIGLIVLAALGAFVGWRLVR
jgi:murein DD-endopeptidase MepM/ murein hydrolase activator NlpD